MNLTTSDSNVSERHMMINYHNVEQEHWDAFHHHLENNCTNKEILSKLDTLYDQWNTFTSNLDSPNYTSISVNWQSRIDQIWTSILHVLIDSITDTLPIIWAVPPAL